MVSPQMPSLIAHWKQGNGFSSWYRPLDTMIPLDCSGSSVMEDLVKSLGVFIISIRYNALKTKKKKLYHYHVEKWLILLHRIDPEAYWKLGF